jgi:poly-gamma-glutamate biosynthesis protein PgsC/CapC
MQLLPIAIGIGLAVSLVFSELFGLAAGGMVVPGYIALAMSRPLDVALTLAVGVLTYAIVHALSSTVIIYGRRRTVIMILIGYLLGMSIGTLSLEPLGIAHRGSSTELAIVGFIGPGLIAIWIDRQGLVETLSVLITAATVVRLVMILIFGMELSG